MEKEWKLTISGDVDALRTVQYEVLGDIRRSVWYGEIRPDGSAVVVLSGNLAKFDVMYRDAMSTLSPNDKQAADSRDVPGRAK